MATDGSIVFQQEGSGHVLQPTALVHEAYLALARLRPHGFGSPYELQSLVGKLMRQILIDHARRVHATKRGGTAQHVPVSDALDAVDDSTVQRPGEFGAG